MKLPEARKLILSRLMTQRLDLPLGGELEGVSWALRHMNRLGLIEYVRRNQNEPAFAVTITPYGRAIVAPPPF